MSFLITEKSYFDGVAPLCVILRNGEFLSIKGTSWGPFDSTVVLALLEQYNASLRCKSILLGQYHHQSCSLIVLSDNDNSFSDAAYQWLNLRDFLPELNSALFRLASRALQLAYWQIDHKYCGRCAQETSLTIQSDELACQCVSCGHMVFPRISPCVIGLVTDGPRILLARGIRHRPELFSCLAGFIEAGENAEQAFEREIKEEVGVSVCNIRYCGSQPWPFPSQLMLGFYADYQGGDVLVDGKEILEANWYTKETLPVLPSAHSISGSLIRDYFAIPYSETHTL
jgi:NAD+ diphosphatase